MSGDTERSGEGARMITFDEAAARGDFIQLERQPAAADDDSLDRDPVIFSRRLFSDDLIRDLGGDPEAQGLT